MGVLKPVSPALPQPVRAARRAAVRRLRTLSWAGWVKVTVSETSEILQSWIGNLSDVAGGMAVTRP